MSHSRTDARSVCGRVPAEPRRSRSLRAGFSHSGWGTNGSYLGGAGNVTEAATRGGRMSAGNPWSPLTLHLSNSGSTNAARTSSRRKGSGVKDPARPGGGRSSRSTSTSRGAARRTEAETGLPSYDCETVRSPSSLRKLSTPWALRPQSSSSRNSVRTRTTRLVFWVRRSISRCCAAEIGSPTRAPTGATSGQPCAWKLRLPTCRATSC